MALRRHPTTMAGRLLLLALQFITHFFWSSTIASASSNVVLKNWSRNRIEINWINPSTKEHLIMRSVDPNETFSVSSFAGHEFELRQLPDEASGQCSSDDKTCSIAYLIVGDDEEQRFRLLDDMSIAPDHYDPYEWIAGDGISQSWTEDNVPSVAECKQLASDRLKSAQDGEQQELALDVFYACLEAHATPFINNWNDEIEFEAIVRSTIGGHMENKTCYDATMPSSPDVELRTWNSFRDGVDRQVHVKLDRPASRIHVIENFASDDECTAMESAAEAKLARASVADGKGGTRFSENRKAMQAGITPDWSEEENGDLVSRLSRRVYDYANHELGLNITHHGQENLMSIQYFGRGYDDDEPDRYTPHCDGACDGTRFQHGTRMATMVIYCTVPERGGHTNFQNSNVHVEPRKGDGLFFSYMDPETTRTDDHFTQHSGCPTYEGEKKIITQWIRLGVDEDNPWTSLNTLGIKKVESDV